MVNAMNLQIRDPRAHKLARELAAERKVSLTEAVIDALEAELRRARTPLAKRLALIADTLQAQATKGGRDLSREEIDEMWGH